MSFSKDALPKLFQALSFAAVQHQYQRRGGYGRLPYINHLIKVTEVLIQIAKETDEHILLAAVLHDIIEDTDVTVSDVAQQFGEKVAAIVEELTDDMSLPYYERKQLQIDRAHQLSEAARKIRIADKVSNMRDLMTYPIDWPMEKKQAYIINSKEIVERIRGVNIELEKWFDETVALAKEHFKLS